MAHLYVKRPVKKFEADGCFGEIVRGEGGNYYFVFVTASGAVWACGNYVLTDAGYDGQFATIEAAEQAARAWLQAWFAETP